ncbi:hypothetical protein ACJMK2_027913 [Sinanodonta woodiana]|uniref:Uncharacterized protein n=1 Tax=Sinanodonta woodiana TaxID=1069815 RepID=A0ABD3X5F1_SINWO
MRYELYRLYLEKIMLKEKANNTRISPEALQYDSEKVRHLTLLNCKVVMALFQFLSSSVFD